MTNRPDSVDSNPSGGTLSLSRIVWASIARDWRVALSVALGVATATTVIVGALLVGDSMRGSLRELTIERLGKTDSLLMPGNFFRAEGVLEGAVPLILFTRGVAEAEQDGKLRRAGKVQLIGCDESFWDLDVAGIRPSQLPDDDGVVLNQSAAQELGVKVDDLITLRLPVEQAVPADSPLGRRDLQSEGLPRMRVLEILPDRGLGRFSVSASQAAPQTVFLSRAIVADVLQREGQANALLTDHSIESEDLAPELSDLDLNLRRVRRGFDSANGESQTIFDYYSLTSDRMLLPESVVERVTETLGGERVKPVLTYLANAIEKLDEDGEVVSTVTYSTITAIDSSDALPLEFDDPGDSSIPVVVNDWTANRLGAEMGTRLRIAYYEPEVENGKEIERFFDATVTGIVPITEPATPYRRSRVAKFDQPPTIYNDPDLTPHVPGVTDQDSISDWDLPFKLTRKVPKEDDAYWNNHRLTPKLFLRLADGQRLFGSRFGQTTGLRIDVGAAEEIDALDVRLRDALREDLPQFGWSVIPIRKQQLSASRGTTPFDGLFLALSFFVILAAVMLITMLFRLGLAQRLTQFGTLLAVGWPPSQVARVSRIEGLWVAGFGVLIGLVGGVGYASAVLWALRSWWVGAVTVPFLTFHWTFLSLTIGAAAGWLVAAITLWITTRSILGVDARTLLSGRDLDRAPNRAAKQGTIYRNVAWILAVAALGVAIGGVLAGGAQATAGGFVGGGMLLLVAGLVAIFSRLRAPRRIDPADAADRSSESYSLTGMASRNATRHPLRSTLTIGLMATASFLIIAISAFRLEPSDEGTGGFDLIASTAQPIYRDLSQTEVQASLLGPDAKLLADAHVVPMRVKLGQDASCNNLYQATRPTVLGVPATMREVTGAWALPGFAWFATAELAENGSPWSLLEQPATGTENDPIPMILDQNTAMYSLQMYAGIGETKSFTYDAGETLHFKVVGLLSNTLLQGRLLIGNDNFEQAFQAVSGNQYFLIANADDEQRTAIAEALESRLGDVGMDVSDSRDVLSRMFAVQNTYLRTFQSLGALGLLLGTIGLSVAQLRSVLERRRELAVLRAVGFTRQRLATMVMSETAWLLVVGIGCGALCAAIAVLPHAVVNGLRPPIVEPLLTILGILVFGLLAGLLAVTRVVRMSLLESLRAE